MDWIIYIDKKSFYKWVHKTMINWTKIDTVLLDMDGTLLDLHFDNYFWQVYLGKRYAEHYNISELEANAILSKVFKETEGTQNWYCLDFWREKLQLDITTLKHEVKHLIALHQHAEEFLTCIYKQKNVILVTNAHPDSLNLKLDQTNIERFFSKIISAHYYQEPKESMLFWEKFNSDIDFDPQRSLLVEDNLQVLRTAKIYGIAHLVAVTRPDSNIPVSPTSEFLAIEDFSELIIPDSWE